MYIYVYYALYVKNIYMYIHVCIYISAYYVTYKSMLRQQT